MRQVKDLPRLGQKPSDFPSCDDVLKCAAKEGDPVSSFLDTSLQGLQALGHGAAAERWKAQAKFQESQQSINVLEWVPALSFGHLLLPCITTEVSAEADKG